MQHSRRSAPLLARRSLVRAALAAGTLPWWVQSVQAQTAALAETVKAAEAEGRLVIAGPPIQPYRQSILEFEKAYPKIKVEYTGLSPTEFDAKVRAERKAGLFLWDVRISGASGSAYTEQLPAGWFDPVRPLLVDPDVLNDAKWLGGFEAGFMDKSKRYLYAFQAGLQHNIYIDRAQIPEGELTTMADLLNPKWKGKIAMMDPRTRGAGHTVTLLIRFLGEDKARQFLEQQQPVYTTTARQLGEWAVRGTYPITSGMSPSELTTWQSQGRGKTLKPMVAPPEQTTWTPGWGILMVMNKAPHPAATKLFANWMLSQPAQKDWAARGFVNSRRTDVPPGLEASLMTLEAFQKGLTFNSEANADLAIESAKLATATIK